MGLDGFSALPLPSLQPIRSSKPIWLLFPHNPNAQKQNCKNPSSWEGTLRLWNPLKMEPMESIEEKKSWNPLRSGSCAEMETDASETHLSKGMNKRTEKWKKKIERWRRGRDKEENHLLSCSRGQKNNIRDDRWKMPDFYCSPSRIPLSREISNARAGAGICKCPFFGIWKCRNFKVLEKRDFWKEFQNS